jgi:NAD(P)-dependent dehydrogenase (short-subunit alcohol dehydrogenase family)
VKVAGKVVLITGGASGLGEASARHLHQQGASVVLFDRDESGCRRISDELGERASFVVGDVLDDASTTDAVAAATARGGVRAVVACAGGARAMARTVGRDGWPHDRELFEETVALNLLGTFNTLRLAAAAMAALEPVDDDGQRGAFVSVASIAGYEGQIGQLAYGAAKAGVIGMTLIAARDLSAQGIRVNCIAPGTIRTKAWDLAPGEMEESLKATIPFPRRLGRPEEFAALVEHLITNDYLNGHVARIDGAVRFGPR